MLSAGVDAIALDTRIFTLSQNDIAAVCDAYALGSLLEFEQEKNILVSHSNFFAFAKTTHGSHAFKFYPADAARTIAYEYALNQFLIRRGFVTPQMHCTKKGVAYVPCQDRLAACYDYVNASEAWRLIQKKGTAHRVNLALLSLKSHLTHLPADIACPEHESITTAVQSLAESSKRTVSAQHKKYLLRALKEIYSTYRSRRRYFTRQKLHTNASLTNLLLDDRTVYTLDLSHVEIGYGLSDLASLVISCHFLGIPQRTISSVIDDYKDVHNLKTGSLPVLKTLIDLGLAKELIKTLRREESLGASSQPPALKKTYARLLSKRRRLILKLL